MKFKLVFILTFILSLAKTNSAMAATFVPYSIQAQRSIGSVRTINNVLELNTGTGSRTPSELSRFLGTNVSVSVAEGSAASFSLAERGMYFFEYQLETQERDGDDEFQLFNGKKWKVITDTTVVKTRPNASYHLSEWRQSSFNNRHNTVTFLANDTSDRRGITILRVRNLRRKVSEDSVLLGVGCMGLFFASKFNVSSMDFKP